MNDIIVRYRLFTYKTYTIVELLYVSDSVRHVVTGPIGIPHKISFESNEEAINDYNQTNKNLIDVVSENISFYSVKVEEKEDFTFEIYRII